MRSAHTGVGIGISTLNAGNTDWQRNQTRGTAHATCKVGRQTNRHWETGTIHWVKLCTRNVGAPTFVDAAIWLLTQLEVVIKQHMSNGTGFVSTACSCAVLGMVSTLEQGAGTKGQQSAVGESGFSW